MDLMRELDLTRHKGSQEVMAESWRRDRVVPVALCLPKGLLYLTDDRSHCNWDHVVTFPQGTFAFVGPFLH